MCAGRARSACSNASSARSAKVWDREKIVIIPDHYIFTADSKSNRNVDILRDFVREQGIKYFYDVIDDPNGHWVFDASKGQLKRQYGSNYAGVCHTALPAKGHTRPGEILFGTDSHTCMAGAFNEFATGIGNTDAGFVIGTGKLLLKVPETMRFWLEGKLQTGVMAKDVILHCIGEIGFDGATYRAMQFDGPGAKALIDGRPHDHRQHGHRSRRQERHLRTGREDVRLRGRADESQRHEVEVRPVFCDADDKQKFVYDKKFDLSKLEPTVACHPNPGHRKLAKELGNIKLDRAYIGSCTGGKTSDFLAFAEVIKGHKVKIDTFGVPATPEIVRDLQADKDERQDRLAGPRRRGRADDRERQLRRLPRRAGRHVRPPEQADEVHQRHEPEFPRPHGPPGVAGVPRVALHRRRQRHHGAHHRSEGVLVTAMTVSHWRPDRRRIQAPIA